MSDRSQSDSGSRTHHQILSQHQLKKSVERRVILLLIISLVIMLASMLWSIYRWYFAYARFGPAVVWRWSSPAIGIAVLAFLLALYSGLFLLRNRQRKIYTSADGLWLINGQNRSMLDWKNISSIRSTAAHYLWSQKDENPQLRILLRTTDDVLIKVPPYLTSLDEAQQIIKRKIYTSAMNRYREMMKAGQSLAFGPLQLTRRGVIYRKRIEPWQNFREVKIEGGRLEVEFRGSEGTRKISIPAWHVPNIDLCVQLLRNIEY
jgi:hypothetical protein